jgi:hypothetical protein
MMTSVSRLYKVMVTFPEQVSPCLHKPHFIAISFENPAAKDLDPEDMR